MQTLRLKSYFNFEHWDYINICSKYNQFKVKKNCLEKPMSHQKCGKFRGTLISMVIVQ